MGLSVGIVGLPNVGKSTLFNALLKKQTALAANYPFATIEPNIGIVDVPDPRLFRLAEIVVADNGLQKSEKAIPEKIIPSSIKFYDIAGLVKGASAGEGLGNEFLTHIREVDAILQVVRDFEDTNIVRSGSVSPEEDIAIINTELILADLQLIDKKIAKFGKEISSIKSKDEIEKYEIVRHIKDLLDRGDLGALQKLSEDEKLKIKEFSLLSLKPIVYVYNASEADLDVNITPNEKSSYYNRLRICAKIESEICSIEDTKERSEFMLQYGLSEAGLDKVIRKCFSVLNLETYLTMGVKEVRAWTITKGTLAPKAAGVIHTDFEKGFIAADVVSYSDLDPIGSLKKAKELGKVRLEGKNYIVKDGDVIEFRVNT